MASGSPGRYSYDFVVIGGGSAGLTAARFAARLGKRVAIVEGGRLGGDCTWTGCVPSKALLRAARAAHDVRTAHLFGIEAGDPRTQWPAVMSRVRSVINQLYASESPSALEAEGIDTYWGLASFIDPHRITAGDAVIEGKRFLLATGARPSVPPIPGLDRTNYVTYESIWDLEALPGELLIVGGGPIGCELAQAFRRLGSRVTVLESAGRILGNAEPEVSDLLTRVLVAEGVEVKLGVSIDAVSSTEGRPAVRVPGQEWTADTLLMATGRAPSIATLGLDNAGVEWTARGIEVDGALRTSQKHIYAAGDCTGGAQFTHYAGWQGFMAARNALLPGRARGLLHTVPWGLFTEPEVAQSGLTEAEARTRHGDSVRVTLWPLETSDRPVIDSGEAGFIKLVATKRGRLLGVTIVGARAGEMVQEWAMAIRNRARLSDLALSPHIYPTYSMSTQQLAADAAVTGLLSGLSGRVILALSRLKG
ncbi:MAG: NAD(P)/FAD-dependent oxidoreductase [Chloroflexota bacterium]|nr:NAD(P)/FAD-dependent oxidoreductase [Chloroflexota bacterium]